MATSTATSCEVAVASGVSRPTLYREFGTKDGVGEALVAREADRFFSGIAEQLEQHDDPPEGVRAAVRFTLDEAGGNPLLRAILTGSRIDSSAAKPGNASLDQVLAVDHKLGAATPITSVALGVGDDSTKSGTTLSYGVGGAA